MLTAVCSPVLQPCGFSDRMCADCPSRKSIGPWASQVQTPGRYKKILEVLVRTSSPYSYCREGWQLCWAVPCRQVIPLLEPHSFSAWLACLWKDKEIFSYLLRKDGPCLELGNSVSLASDKTMRTPREKYPEPETSRVSPTQAALWCPTEPSPWSRTCWCLAGTCTTSQHRSSSLGLVTWTKPEQPPQSWISHRCRSPPLSHWEDIVASSENAVPVRPCDHGDPLLAFSLTILKALLE